MKMKFTIIALCACLIACKHLKKANNIIVYDDAENYSSFVNDGLKNKIQNKTGEDYREQITYLGSVKIKGQLFYVLSAYREVQAAITIHGHSRIHFLNQNKELIRTYYLSLPEQLPFKVENTSLFFHYIEGKTKQGKVYEENISDGFPKYICVAPNDCY